MQHRSARSPESFAIRLSADEPVHLQFVDTDDESEEAQGPRNIESEVLALLRTESHGVRRDDMRKKLEVNNGALVRALKSLQTAGTVVDHKPLWSLADNGVPEAPQEPDC